MAAGVPTVLLLELLDGGDARFWDELTKAHDLPAKAPGYYGYASASYRGKLKRSAFTSFAEQWHAHPSPFARKMLLRYVDDGCGRPGHRALVRQILRIAEKKSDVELQNHLIVALDRLIRLKKSRRRDWTTGEVVTHLGRARTTSRELRRMFGHAHPRPLVFTGNTRELLRRAALRPLRQLGYRDGTAYVARALDVLAGYEDVHLDTAEKLLASRALLWILAARSPVLWRDGRKIRVEGGKKLADLSFSPLHSEAWDAHAGVVIDRLPGLRSVFVRKQLTAWLERAHAEKLAALPLDRIRAWLASPHADLLALGVRLLGKALEGQHLTVAEWVELATIDDASVALAVAEQMAKAVTPARVSLADATKLALCAHAPVAALGAGFFEGKRPKDEAELLAALGVLRAKVGAAREKLLPWALPLVLDAKLGTAAHVRELCDMPHADVRTAGLGLLLNERFADEPTLWAALSESPYPDVRAFLLRHLGVRGALLSPEGLERLWATTILAVHGGSRDKRRALSTVGARLSASTDDAERRSLVALAALALRSVREPERRAAMGPLVASAARDPALAALLAELVPELSTTFASPDALPALPARRTPFVPRARRSA